MKKKFLKSMKKKAKQRMKKDLYIKKNLLMKNLKNRSNLSEVDDWMKQSWTHKKRLQK